MRAYRLADDIEVRGGLRHGAAVHDLLPCLRLVLLKYARYAVELHDGPFRNNGGKAPDAGGIGFREIFSRVDAGVVQRL